MRLTKQSISDMLRSLATRRLAHSLTRPFCDASTESISHVLPAFDNIKTSSEDRIAIVEIHRPRELNALNSQTLQEVAEAMETYDKDPSVSVIILTGTARVFAAGNDVPELATRSFHSLRYRHDDATAIDRVAATRKPVVAAVNGFALAGGCELAMASDIVIAAEDAMFGQPDILLATVPNAGGTQRLVRAIGKAKAMEMALTGRQMDAEEAERAGLVTRITKKGKALQEAKDVATVIAKHSLPVVIATKECVNVGFETSLAEGIRFERRAFQSTFALHDCKEGMKAFIDGRKPTYSNK